jgi:carboxypeptidase PM20D1
MKKTIFKGLLAALLLLVTVVLVRTFAPSGDTQIGTQFSFTPDEARVTSLMSGAVGYKTISFGRDKPTSGEQLIGFHQYLAKHFPRVHQNLKVEIVNQYSLLYTWEGSQPEQKPVLLLGHLDVVPVIPGTQEDWQYPPYGGVVADGFIWGRGTLDNKVNIIGILEAAENMLEAGLRPSRTIYFAFGHDEEQGGIDGALEISKRLESRGVQAEFLIDEGGLVTSGVVPGVDVPLAIIAPAEKGIVTLELKAKGAGGHSSVPPKQSSIGILAAAITSLEANQFPRDFSHTRQFLEAVADEMSLANRIVMKNLWLFKPVVMSSLANDMQSQASMRTTTAATIIAGGIKANVLPIDATAKVNFRILPGETPDSVRNRVIEVINDSRVSVDFDTSGQRGMGPSPVSPTSGFGWDQITGAIRDTAAPQRILVTPRLLVAATDTRHYRNITPNHYRFTYMALPAADLGTIHGTNERIGVKTLNDTVRFFHRLMSGL